jgi:hypothetical protein
MKKTLGFALALSLLSLPALRAHAMTIEEAGEKAIGLMEQMASIIDKDKDACDKMAADLNRFQDDNAALLKELNEIKGKRTDADKKAFREKYAARLKAAQEKMTPGAMKCEKDEKVKAAMMKMR